MPLLVDLGPLWLSFEVATIATLLAAVVGVACAVGLAWRRFFGRELIDAITTTPMVMPPTVLGYYVLVALGRQSVLGRAWESLTGAPIVFTRTGAVIAAALGSLPLVIKSARAALEAVDPTLIRAARTLGAGPVRAFFTVHLPLAARGIRAGIVLGFARALGDFGVTLMVAGDIPGETQTAALAIYDAIQSHREAEAAGMIAVLTSVSVFALYIVNKWATRRA
jgi:molybdate transport system permease protein